MSRLARGALCALLLSFSVPATASAAFGDRPLRMGMHGKDVRMLQTLLTKAGFVIVADGAYGRRTRRAVGRWEARRDRRVNGKMSRADQLALRREFKTPISVPGPQVDGNDSLMLLGGRVRPSVTARVSAAGEVVAEVADASGAVVRSLRRTASGPGEIKLRWNGRIRRRPAPEGTYLVRLGDATAGASAVGEPKRFELRHNVFPIAGRHDRGRSAANGFGGGRGHQGQDMFARCGTPVRAAQGGTVVRSGLPLRGRQLRGRPRLGLGRGLRLHAPARRAEAPQGRQGQDGRAVRARRRDGSRERLPPALRAVVQARLVQRRRGLRPAPEAAPVGRLVLSLTSPRPVLTLFAHATRGGAVR